MDWPQLIADRARVSGILLVDDLARQFAISETAVRNALRRQERRGLVEHLGNKIYLNRLVRDFSGRELINLLRADAYLSLETVLRDTGISTQSTTMLTCVTPGRPGQFRSKSLRIVFRRISLNLFWGFRQKRTRYGTYNIAEPEKALLDWIYLHRQEGSAVDTDELDLERLDRPKLLEYADRYPLPVKAQILEALARLNSAAHVPRVE
jgi:hypothetical protein